MFFSWFFSSHLSHFGWSILASPPISDEDESEDLRGCWGFYMIEPVNSPTSTYAYISLNMILVTKQ